MQLNIQISMQIVQREKPNSSVGTEQAPGRGPPPCGVAHNFHLVRRYMGIPCAICKAV